MTLLCMSEHVAPSSRMSDGVFELGAGCMGACMAVLEHLVLGVRLSVHTWHHASWFAHGVVRTQPFAIFLARQWLGVRCVARLSVRNPAQDGRALFEELGGA